MVSGYAIETRELCRTYKVGFRMRSVNALKSLSLRVPAGRTFGFVGPNGAGKTTTLKILMGLGKPTSGSALVLGQDSGCWRSRRKVGFLPERPYFPPHLTGREFLLLIADLLNLPQPVAPEIDLLLHRVDLSDRADRPLRGYSKGMLQRIGMAQALLGSPELLVLDEPMSGLDPMGRALIRSLIEELHADGKTVFFSSHILSDVEHLCDELAIIHQGQLVHSGPLNAFLAQHEATYRVKAVGLPEPQSLLTEGVHLMPSSAERPTFVCQNLPAMELLQQRISQAGGRLVELTTERPLLEELVVQRLRTGAPS